MDVLALGGVQGHLPPDASPSKSHDSVVVSSKASGSVACKRLADVFHPGRPGRSWGFVKLKVSPLLGNQPSFTRESDPPEPESSEAFAKWVDLPLPLLEMIFRLVADGPQDWAHRQAMFQVLAVCQAWRTVGKCIFFPDPWSSPTILCHPLQLFSLSPCTLPGGLLRCFVRRQQASERGGGTKFFLYMGADHTQPCQCKFLLAALFVSRWETQMYFTGACDGAPAARVQANVFGTRYALCLDPSVRPFADATGPSTPLPLPLAPDAVGARRARCAMPLAEVQYKTRLKGFMRPRRMKVTLPSPAALGVSIGLPGPVRSESPRGPADAAMPTAEPVPAAARPQGQPGADVAAEVEDAGALAEATQRNSLLHALSTLTILQARAKGGEGSGGESEAGGADTQLRNKAPHWNEQLRCWCLNFRGRVKHASVKNFQLVRAADPNRAMAMQFGKVEANTYIMDFNPTIISAAQAFAIALSTFDTKVLL